MKLKKRSHIDYIFCWLVAAFAIGRLSFILYNRELSSNLWQDLWQACLHGIPHDVMIALLLLIIPCLATIWARVRPNLPLRRLLMPYYIIAGVLCSIIIGADMVMYEFWQFKLGAVVLSYASSPEGASNSVSIGFFLTRLIAVLTLMLLFIIPCIRLTPHIGRRDNTHPLRAMTYIVMAGLLSCCISVRTAYYNGCSLFTNHAATNPIGAFVSSFHMGKTQAERYTYMSQEECERITAELYPQGMDDVTDSLLTTSRPDVLFVFMESFGGKFVKELGGLPDVSPNLSRLIPEGIFWDNYYSNSFRTDRATASLLTGTVSYPEHSPMTAVSTHASLPSMARTFEKADYTTTFLYAGPMTNMGKRTFIENIGFQTLLDNTAFRPEEQTGAWGVDDHISAQKAFRLIAEQDGKQPHLLFYQTLSSHEPWTVPYQRLEDKRLNAFAYTDQSVGDLVDSLKTLPQWDNLLIIILPDHGFLYEQSYEDPEFFHSPMLWMGGAIRQPRRMTQLINQSDVAATLFAQLGLPHDDYRWSRNVLSSKYTQPFVYCNYPAGMMLRETSAYTLYDLSAEFIIAQQSDEDGSCLTRAKAILQTSCSELE